MRTICTLCTLRSHVQCMWLVQSVCVCLHHAQISNFHCRILSPTTTQRLKIAYGVQIKIVLSSENSNIVHFICTMFWSGLSPFKLARLCCANQAIWYLLNVGAIPNEQTSSVNTEWFKTGTRAPAPARPYNMHKTHQCTAQWMLLKLKESAWENKTRGMLYQLISSSSSFSVCSLWMCVCVFVLFLPTSLSSRLAEMRQSEFQTSREKNSHTHNTHIYIV